VFPPAVAAVSMSGAAGSARSAFTSRRTSPVRAARSSSGLMVGGEVTWGCGVGQEEVVVVGVDGGEVSTSGEAIVRAGVGGGEGGMLNSGFMLLMTCFASNFILHFNPRIS
jgi:hypothetical protein